jgi:hypothetical protein
MSMSLNLQPFISPTRHHAQVAHSAVDICDLHVARVCNMHLSRTGVHL